MESNALTNTILDGEYDIFHWGWYVEPDPDVDAQRTSPAVSAATGRTPGTATRSTTSSTRRRTSRWTTRSASEMIKQMQQILCEDSPYLVIGYTKTGQAFRSDRFACFEPQPEPGGVLLMQYGAPNYSLLRPAEDAGDCDGDRRRRSARPCDVAAASADDGGINAVLIVRRCAAARAAGGRWRVPRGAPTGDRGRPRVATSRPGASG